MIEAARFYERRRQGVGFRFLQRVEEMSRRIGDGPEGGAPFGRKDRRRSVPGFPYGVVLASPRA